jgi:hypothetical protein
MSCDVCYFAALGGGRGTFRGWSSIALAQIMFGAEPCRDHPSVLAFNSKEKTGKVAVRDEKRVQTTSLEHQLLGLPRDQQPQAHREQNHQ